MTYITPAVLLIAVLTTTALSNPLPPLTIQQLLTLAPTTLDRLALLPNPSDHVFSFTNTTVGVTTGLGGHTVKADTSTFPAVIGSGGSITMGFIGPCGFNTLHTHPRSAELNVVVQGTLQGSVTVENGAPHMEHVLKQYEMTVFPQGAMHSEFNPNCEPAVFVAAFSSEDPGVQQSLQTILGFEDEVIKALVAGDAVVDGRNLEAFRKHVPVSVAKGVESCLKKCGL